MIQIFKVFSSGVFYPFYSDTLCIWQDMTVITIFFMFFDVLGFGVVISFLHPGGLITIHTSNFKDKLIK